MQPAADFVPAVAANKLMRESRSGALATLMPGSGDPYCSLVNIASATDADLANARLKAFATRCGAAWNQKGERRFVGHTTNSSIG